MTIENFEIALRDDKLSTWFEDNVVKLIKGGRGYSRENKITKEIVNIINQENIKAHKKNKDLKDNHNLDIWDSINKDIGEAAHNHSFQPASHGPEHIIADYFKRLKQGCDSTFFGLMYLCDLDKLGTNTLLPLSYVEQWNGVFRQQQIDNKTAMENLLRRLPGGIQIHKAFHNLKSPTESTILNYDIYVLKMKFNKETALKIYNEFNKEDFFGRVGFDRSLLN